MIDQSPAEPKPAATEPARAEGSTSSSIHSVLTWFVWLGLLLVLANVVAVLLLDERPGQLLNSAFFDGTCDGCAETATGALALIGTFLIFVGWWPQRQALGNSGLLLAGLALGGLALVGFAGARSAEPKVIAAIQGGPLQLIAVDSRTQIACDDTSRLLKSTDSHYEPAISQDGTSIAFGVEKKAGNIELRKADLTRFDGDREIISSQPFPVPRGSGFSDRYPAWSPQEDLAFVRQPYEPSAKPRAPSGQLHVAWADTGHLDVIERPVETQRPDFSPDGRWLAFSGFSGGALSLWVVEVVHQDGTLGKPREVFTGESLSDVDPAERAGLMNLNHPRWHPNGSGLLFVAHGRDRLGSTGLGYIELDEGVVVDGSFRWVDGLHPDYSDDEYITGGPKIPEWSPDGRVIVIGQEPETGLGEERAVLFDVEARTTSALTAVSCPPMMDFAWWRDSRGFGSRVRSVFFP